MAKTPKKKTPDAGFSPSSPYSPESIITELQRMENLRKSSNSGQGPGEPVSNSPSSMYTPMDERIHEDLQR